MQGYIDFQAICDFLTKNESFVLNIVSLIGTFVFIIKIVRACSKKSKSLYKDVIKNVIVGYKR